MCLITPTSDQSTSDHDDVTQTIRNNNAQGASVPCMQKVPRKRASGKVHKRKYAVSPRTVPVNSVHPNLQKKDAYKKIWQRSMPKNDSSDSIEYKKNLLTWLCTPMDDIKDLDMLQANIKDLFIEHTKRLHDAQTAYLEAIAIGAQLVRRCEFCAEKKAFRARNMCCLELLMQRDPVSVLIGGIKWNGIPKKHLEDFLEESGLLEKDEGLRYRLTRSRMSEREERLFQSMCGTISVPMTTPNWQEVVRKKFTDEIARRQCNGDEDPYVPFDQRVFFPPNTRYRCCASRTTDATATSTTPSIS